MFFGSGDETRLYVNGNLYHRISGEPYMNPNIAYPASDTHTIAVGSSTDFAFRADHSRYGDALDFLAPSNGGYRGITTADRMGEAGYEQGDYYLDFGGTSSAAPLAAGVGALMLSIDPDLTPEDLCVLLQETCTKTGDVVYDPNGRNEYYGYGRIDANAAISAVIKSLDTASRVGVHRLWSETHARHFYTIDESEKEEFLQDTDAAWQDEGVVYYALANVDEPSATPVHQLFSPNLNSYFYTTSGSERNRLTDGYPGVWDYQKIAFYVLPEGQHSIGASPVYRFWSDVLGCHFYTIDGAEKNKLINNYPDVWRYEGVVWYAYSER